MAIKFMKPADAFYLVKEVPYCGEVQFCVILKKLPNDVSGNCRYEAAIIDLDELILRYQISRETEVNRFKFTGHSQTEAYEAEWALDEYLKLEEVLKRYEPW